MCLVLSYRFLQAKLHTKLLRGRQLLATPLTKNQKDNDNLKEKAADFTAAFLIGRAEGLRVSFYATRSSEESCEALALRKGGAKCTCTSIITQMLYIFYAMLWYHIS